MIPHSLWSEQRELAWKRRELTDNQNRLSLDNNNDFGERRLRREMEWKKREYSRLRLCWEAYQKQIFDLYKDVLATEQVFKARLRLYETTKPCHKDVLATQKLENLQGTPLNRTTNPSTPGPRTPRIITPATVSRSRSKATTATGTATAATRSLRRKRSNRRKLVSYTQRSRSRGRGRPQSRGRSHDEDRTYRYSNVSDNDYDIEHDRPDVHETHRHEPSYYRRETPHSSVRKEKPLHQIYVPVRSTTRRRRDCNNDYENSDYSYSERSYSYDEESESTKVSLRDRGRVLFSADDGYESAYDDHDDEYRNVRKGRNRITERRRSQSSDDDAVTTSVLSTSFLEPRKPFRRQSTLSSRRSRSIPSLVLKSCEQRRSRASKHCSEIKRSRSYPIKVSKVTSRRKRNRAPSPNVVTEQGFLGDDILPEGDLPIQEGRPSLTQASKASTRKHTHTLSSSLDVVNEAAFSFGDDLLPGDDTPTTSPIKTPTKSTQNHSLSKKPSQSFVYDSLADLAMPTPTGRSTSKKRSRPASFEKETPKPKTPLATARSPLTTTIAPTDDHSKTTTSTATARGNSDFIGSPDTFSPNANGMFFFRKIMDTDLLSLDQSQSEIMIAPPPTAR